MKKVLRLILGLIVLFMSVAIATNASSATPSVYIAFPPNNYQTTASQLFILGTAPPKGKVLINGTTIDRSQAGHFAPSFPLHLGNNYFTIRYQNQQTQIQVERLSTQPQLPAGLAFAKDSLMPNVDIARLPGEVICFSAIAPTQATVSVNLANSTIPLEPQTQKVKLPANSAVLAQQNQPLIQNLSGEYQGCATLPSEGTSLGQPQFRLTMNGESTSQLAAGKVTVLSPLQLEIAEVTADAGVARTGPSTDYSRLTPLPQGTRAAITGHEGNWLRLDYGGWIDSKEVKITEQGVPPHSLIRSILARQVSDSTEVLFPLQVPVPLSIEQGSSTLTLTLYNTTAQTDVIHLDDDPVIERLDWQQVAPTQVQYTFNLKSKQQWGYNLKYNGTTLILSLRHPPKIKGKQLSEIPILLDPGHGGSDSGTTGPTGLNEKTVTLTVAKLVQQQLRARGADVYLTREADQDVSLGERVAMIDRLKPAIAISLHYNSLPDEGDAQHIHGLGAFWYNAQAHSLAVFLHNYIIKQLDRSNYGVFWDNLALTRPTSAPAILLELGFMSNPVEFEWVVNPQQQQQLAVAIADGITQWFRSVS